MVTIYELLEIEEDASKEQIEEAYRKLVLEFRQDPSFDEKKNQENEMILNKIKIAYEILIDDNRRKKYDNDLAMKRAENLIANVVVKEEIKENKEPLQNTNNIVSTETNENNTAIEEKVQKHVEEKKQTSENEILSQKEKKEIKKAAEQEFNQNLKKAKKAEEEYRQAYQNAYNDYLRKMGYTVKEPWTFDRVKRVVISITIIILTFVIMWYIPPVRKLLVSLYQENFIIKALVDLIGMIFKAVFSVFK